MSSLTARDFRNYERADVELGERLTVIVGPNGAGKTNLLEAVYFGCTGRSPRTSNDRDLLRRGATAARVTVTTTDGNGGDHALEAAFQPGEPKLLRLDGSPVDNLWATDARPLISVFLPERLELVKGAPANRRAHLDQLVTALWPARGATRAAYSRALAQRNALLGRIRSGGATPDSLGAWDAELARHGADLMTARAEAVTLLAPRFTSRAADLGLPADAEVAYRPRSTADSADQLAAELLERRTADLERGFTAHGPHRDDLRLLHAGEPLRGFGSQGQQRVGLLALLFAERDLLASERDRRPLMLLDDVMSELDGARRELLAELLREGGQGVVTATELDHVPGHEGEGVTVLEVENGSAKPVVAGSEGSR
ncbi:MAG TPA: DNA replication and repair protein RecF [Thermoleophilaceae bacterium]|nr:DNA replication and repair protein RecF [Thermoleophilaceae bacterium]